MGMEYNVIDTMWVVTFSGGSQPKVAQSGGSNNKTLSICCLISYLLAMNALHAVWVGR